MSIKDIEIAEVEEQIVYNGFIPENIYEPCRLFMIKDLEIGKSYEVSDIRFDRMFCTFYYKIKCNNNNFDGWLPYESFGTRCIKEKYNLK